MKLKLNDFLIIKANWDDKYKNILEIQKIKPFSRK